MIQTVPNKTWYILYWKMGSHLFVRKSWISAFTRATSMATCTQASISFLAKNKIVYIKIDITQVTIYIGI